MEGGSYVGEKNGTQRLNIYMRVRKFYSQEQYGVKTVKEELLWQLLISLYQS